jgi:uncharacterized membrane protein
MAFAIRGVIMSYLVLGLVLFLGVHATSIIAPRWRDAMFARLGEPLWKGVYSLIAILGFALIIWGYAEARATAVVLYQPPHWMRWLAAAFMLPVFPLLLAPYFPGRIKATLKHPMIIAVKSWALAHLLVNGTSADLLLFGSFLAWAVIDHISLKRRAERSIRTLAPRPINDVIAIVLGLLIYVAFLHGLHLRLIGVSPMPYM